MKSTAELVLDPTNAQQAQRRDYHRNYIHELRARTHRDPSTSEWHHSPGPNRARNHCQSSTSFPFPFPRGGGKKPSSLNFSKAIAGGHELPESAGLLVHVNATTQLSGENFNVPWPHGPRQAPILALPRGRLCATPRPPSPGRQRRTVHG